MKTLVTATAVLAVIATVSTATLAQPGRYRFNADNVPGWTLMTPEERTANQQKMWSFKTYDECKAYQDEHHKTMEARAKEQGKTLAAPRANACDAMKARGILK